MKSAILKTYMGLLVLAFQSYAVIVEGTFSGSVNAGYDYTNHFGMGYSAPLHGTSFTGTFSYETDDSGPDVYPYSDPYDLTGYYNGTNLQWLNVSVSILGVTESFHNGSGTANNEWNSVLTDPGNFTGWNYVNVYDYDSYPGGSYVSDQYQLGVREVRDVYDGGLHYTWSEQFSLSVSEFTDGSFTNGVSTAQEFNWEADPSRSYSTTGYFGVYHQIMSGPYTNDLFDFYEFNFTLNQVSARVVDPGVIDPGDLPESVPEPGSLALLGAGMLGFLGYRKKRKK